MRICRLAIRWSGSPALVVGTLLTLVFAAAALAQAVGGGTDTAESAEPVRRAVLEKLDLQVDMVQRVGGLSGRDTRVLRLCAERVLDGRLAGTRRFHTQQVDSFVSQVLADNFWIKVRDSLIGGAAAEQIRLAKAAREERLLTARIDVLLAHLDAWLRLSREQRDSIRPLLQRAFEKSRRRSVSWYRGVDDPELAPVNTLIWTFGGNELTSLKEGVRTVLDEAQFKELDEILDPNGFNMNVQIFDEEAD